MARVRVHYTMANEAVRETFESEGTLDGSVLTFEDDKERTHTITFLDDGLHYRRSGEGQVDFTFLPEHPSEGLYTMLERELAFEIHTHRLDLTPRSIHLTYTLKQADTPVNHSKLALYYDKV